MNLSLNLQNDRDKIGNLIDEALRSCFNKQLMTPGLVSLTNLPTQTTLLLPGQEFLQHLSNSVVDSTITTNRDNATSLPAKAIANSDVSNNSNNLNRHEIQEPPTIADSAS